MLTFKKWSLRSLLTFITERRTVKLATRSKKVKKYCLQGFVAWDDDQHEAGVGGQEDQVPQPQGGLLSGHEIVTPQNFDE